MNRSRKKTPIVAITTADSDKRFKAAEHRRERAVVRTEMAVGGDIPSRKAFGDPWAGDKDGKHYLGRAASAVRK